jgi:hypothetical protein
MLEAEKIAYLGGYTQVGVYCRFFQTIVDLKHCDRECDTCDWKKQETLFNYGLSFGVNHRGER